MRTGSLSLPQNESTTPAFVAHTATYPTTLGRRRGDPLRRTSTLLRALLTAVALVLSLLTTAQLAQALPLLPERGEITAERGPALLHESAKPLPEECRTPREAHARRHHRHHLSWSPLHWCACAVRAELRGQPSIVPRGREAVPIAVRSDALPLRHQVLRR